MSEQPTWVWVLADCSNSDKISPGAALMALHQRGHNRQANYLLRRKLAKMIGGRLVATKAGRAELNARNVAER